MGRGLSDFQLAILKAAAAGYANRSPDTLRGQPVVEVQSGFYWSDQFAESLAKYRRVVSHEAPRRNRMIPIEVDALVQSELYDSVNIACNLAVEVIEDITTWIQSRGAAVFNADHEDGPGIVFLEGKPHVEVVAVFGDMPAARQFAATPYLGMQVSGDERLWSTTVAQLWMPQVADVSVAEVVRIAGDPTNSNRATTSRALKSLERRGLIETGRSNDSDYWRPRGVWITPAGLAVAG
jgi:hypothetical protein